MAFSDPQSVSPSGTAVSLGRVYTPSGDGVFVSADGQVQLEIIPKNGKSKSRVLRLRVSKITSDPLVSTTNVRVRDLVSISVIAPNDGFTVDELVAHLTSLVTWGTASTNANFKKFIAGEN